uniref:Uncharacterized protein n=1 Tax=Acanthochromis polyacanthus TaxID=80966 RepID=A0A3Q1F7Z3_9TELE
MKCAVVFLVLSMVVLMAEPGECIWRHIVHYGGKILHGLFHGGGKANLEDQQLEQLDKLDYNPRRPAFD